MRTTIVLSALALLTPAFANLRLDAIPINKLFARADIECSGSDIACGSTCIPSTYTCCPDKLGGCATDSECQMGDNDEYGCCPEGEICSGDGGAEFIDEKAEGSTNDPSAPVEQKAAGGAQGLKMGGLTVVVVAAAAALL